MDRKRALGQDGRVGSKSSLELYSERVLKGWELFLS